MANVELTIGKHSYTLACADGEEDALSTFAGIVDEQIRTARLANGGLPESRQLLFAAILLAERVHNAEAALQKLKNADAQTAPGEQLISLEELDEVSARLEQLAERLQAIATQSP